MAVQPSHELVSISEKLYLRDKPAEFYEYLADLILMARCLILQDFISEARQTLLKTREILNLHISTSRINFKEIKAPID